MCLLRSLLSLIGLTGVPFMPAFSPAWWARGGLRRAVCRTRKIDRAGAGLHEQRFQDCSPAQVYASLLDDGRYHCSIRTMYRLLDAEGENRERRDQLIHPPYKKPELLASGPNQLWSWDITKLRGPVKWSFYYLYCDPRRLQPLRYRLDDRLS